MKVLNWLGNVFVAVVSLPVFLMLWLPNRLVAQRCPNCGSRWRTELVGEWQGEDWQCHACGHWWTVPSMNVNQRDE